MGEGQSARDDGLDDHGVQAGELGAHQLVFLPVSGMGGVRTLARGGHANLEREDRGYSVTGRAEGATAAAAGADSTGFTTPEGRKAASRARSGTRPDVSRQTAAASSRVR